MGNFTTTEKKYLPYAKLADSAESLIYSDTRKSILLFGRFAEQLTKEIFRLKGLDGLVDNNIKQKERIDILWSYEKKNDYLDVIPVYLDLIRRERNSVAHLSIKLQPGAADSLEIDKLAYSVWAWFLMEFS